MSSEGLEKTLASFEVASTTIVISEEEHISRGQHRLDIENSWTERLVFSGGGDPLDSCGEVRAKAWCSKEIEYKHELLDNCHRPECPICTLDYRIRATRSAVKEIFGKLAAIHNEIDWRLFPSDVIWFMSPDTWDLSIDDLWRAFGRILKKAGVKGAAAILHLFRFRDAAGHEVTWTEYSVKSLVRPSDYTLAREPHFHSIVIGRVEMESDDLYEKTGTGYKKMKTPRGDFKLEVGDVFGIIFYALSHTAISLDKQRQLIHYFGYLKKARIKDEWVEYEEVLCPDCGTPLELHWVKDRIIDDSLVSGFREPWHRKIVYRIYTFEPVVKSASTARATVVPTDLDCGLDFTGIDARVRKVDYVDIDDL